MLKIKPFKPKLNFLILNKVAWLYLFLMFVWLFVALITPAAAVVGSASGATVNAFYNSFSNTTSTWTMLNGVGIATIVFYVVCLVYTIIFIGFYFWKTHKTEFSWKKTVWYIDFALLLGITVVFFAIAMVSPQVQALSQNWALMGEIQQINQFQPQEILQNSDQQSLILKIAIQLGLSNPSGTNVPQSNGAYWANYINAINNFVFHQPAGSLTPLWNYQGTIVSRGAGWTGVCAIFGILISLIVLLPLLVRLGFYLNRQELKEYRQLARTMLANYRASLKNKRETRKKKRDLLEKEDRLWSSLEEINPTSQMNPVEQLSQYELEEKISKATALKEEIEALKQQRADLQKQNSRKKQTYHQATRLKKQKIAVPDAELEDIFKSLDF